VPIIQFPSDIVAMQEIIWRVRPDLIVETGVAHGGSIILYASLLQLIGGAGTVVGVDVDIRPHNRRILSEHPLRDRFTLVEGSSTSAATIAAVKELAKPKERILDCLDSTHSHEHVLNELRAYSPLVKAGSYVVVFDTIIEDFDPGSFPDRPWDRGNNAATAVGSFLKETDRFEVDEDIDAKLLISVAPRGYLKCVK
jgi:cephalosporin hydroxylase